MIPYYEIKKLIKAIQAKKQSRSAMDRTAQCFLKLVIASSGENILMSDLIKIANPNMTEIAPMLSVSEMTPAKLAHIIIGGSMIMMKNSAYLALEEIEELCKKTKNGSSEMAILQEKKETKGWAPFKL